MKVAPRTFTKLCDNGSIPSYRVPGSLDRRVLEDDLVSFMQRNVIPIPVDLTPKKIVTFGLYPGEIVEGASNTSCLVSLGVMLGKEKIKLLIVSDSLGHTCGLRVIEIARKEQRFLKIVYVMPECEVVDPKVPGADEVLYRPVDWSSFKE
jgi:hypothetical protein